MGNFSGINNFRGSRWLDVKIDISKNGYRLPTVTEWQYAARGGNPDDAAWNFKYSGSDNPDDVAWYKMIIPPNAYPVGLKAPNTLRIYDMSGNVSEYCNDDETRFSSYGAKDGYFINPLNLTNSDYKFACGGMVGQGSYFYTVDTLTGENIGSIVSNISFRIARTLTE